MTVTGAPLSVVIWMSFTTIPLENERLKSAGFSLTFFGEKVLTCSVVQVKNYNFFASRFWYVIPNEREGVIQARSPDCNLIKPQMDSPTGVAHASSFAVLRITVDFMLSKSHNWSRIRHPLVDGSPEVLEHEGVDGCVVRQSSIWFRNLEEEEEKSNAFS